MSRKPAGSSLEEILTQVVEASDKVMAMQNKGKKVTNKERESIIRLLKEIIKAIKDFFELEVKTSIREDEQSSYVTKIMPDGDVESIFPKQLDTNIFARHNALLDSAWQVRKSIVEK